MPCVGRRFEQAFKARLLHAQTQIIIFVEQEEALVEPTDMAECFRSQQQAAAIQPLGTADGVSYPVWFFRWRFVEGGTKASGFMSQSGLSNRAKGV
jgi:CHASE1-domain containing sensor protein